MTTLDATAQPRRMSKQDVTARLQKMEELSGVLPTTPRHSERLEEFAQNLERGEVESAAASARANLESRQMQIAPEDAAPELYESPELRAQVAGFARAGVNFFHASPEFWQMSRAKRADAGGSGMVSRVLVQDQRILLETSRIVIRMSEGSGEAERDAILARHGVFFVDSRGLPPRTCRADAPDRPAVDVSLELMTEDAVEYAEPDFVEHIGARRTPTDPDFATQWHHANIVAEAAWDFATGAGVRVAVVDNGFDTAHPDLAFGAASGWFQHTQDFADADFVPGTANMPNGNHGSACAGMIAAVADNGNGGVGVAFDAALSVIACLDDQIGTQSTLARAIAYAADPSLENSAEAGADVIACSLGPNGAVWTMNAVLSDAIDFAATQGRGGLGCPVFWATTNGNHPIGADQVCSHPEVIAVGRSTKTDTDNGSGFGPKLEFLAPGVKVWLPAAGGGYHETTGTSFAAPCAAGIGALVLEAHSALTAAELREVLRETCDKVGHLPYFNGHNIRYGHGRLNAESAVAEARRRAAGV